jgi:hypothetical protein
MTLKRDESYPDFCASVGGVRERHLAALDGCRGVVRRQRPVRVRCPLTR